MNWGILSTGRIANVFASALNFVDDACLYAVASRSKEKALQFAEQHGVKKAYGSYVELASDKAIDIIYVATPMSNHYEDVKLCFEHGKSVLCEKCITMNADQLRHLIALAKEKNLFFMEAMWMKFHPAYQEAIKWVQQERIGDIQMVRADISKLIPYKEGDRIFELSLGGGVLLDLGVYAVTMACEYLGGHPVDISGCYAPAPNGADFVDSLLLHYPHGSAVLNIGFGYYTPVSAIILGTKGRIEFDEYFHRTNAVSLFDNAGNLLERFDQPHAFNGYEGEIIEVERCLRENKKESSVNPLSSTLSVLNILDSIRRRWNFIYDGETPLP